MFGITKEQIHDLPEVTYPGKVHVVDTPSRALDALRYLRRQAIIGFDTETRPSFQRDLHYTVSLMQLATLEECFLFRLKMIGSLEPLMALMADPEVLKIGLSTKDDFHSIARVAQIEPHGFVELQEMVKQYDIADLSLQKIYALLFNRRISKTQRLTNWEAERLSESQQRYAAIDAWACLRIYNHLQAGDFHPEDCPYILPEPEAVSAAEEAQPASPSPKTTTEEQTGDVAEQGMSAKPAKPKRKRHPRKPKAVEGEAEVAETATIVEKPEQPAKPKRRRHTPKPKTEE